MEQKVQKECERYKISTQNLSGGFSAIPVLPINSTVSLVIHSLKKYKYNIQKCNIRYFSGKFVQLHFSQDEASYLLTIEAPAPIEFALLQCNTPIQFMEVEKSSAVVSFSRCDPTVCLYKNSINTYSMVSIF